MEKNKGIKKFIGTRQFYAGVVFVAVPIIIQNVITNFVSLLDNIMVGKIGTEEMSGVAIVNQLQFVFILAIFGLFSGIGIFGAQYFGKRDNEGLKISFRFKLYSGIVILLAAMSIFIFWGDNLINLYLHDGEAGLDLNATFNYAKAYLKVMLWGMPPFLATQLYATSLKETQNTKAPMTAGVIAVFVNLILNYILIYGKFGAPKLGVVGAAIATVISRYIECCINIFWAHTNPNKVPFIEGLYGKLEIPKALTKKILITAMPLFLNEFMWSFGQTTQNQLMSLRGLEVISAINIASTSVSIFNSLYLAMGEVIAIMVGNALGTGDAELAIDTDRKLIVLDVVFTLAISIVTYFASPLIVNVYNSEVLVKSLATSFIKISAIYLVAQAATNACYFTVRSGGKTLLTFLLDSCFVWVCPIPIAYCTVHFTDLGIIPIYILVFGTNIIKFLISLIFVVKKTWVNNLVKEN